MKQFKDLKIGDVVVNLDDETEYTITRIESHNNSLMVSGFRRLYYDNGWNYFSINENKYCENINKFDNPYFITPKENLEEFREVYKFGIQKGETDFKYKIKSLFEIE